MKLSRALHWTPQKFTCEVLVGGMKSMTTLRKRAQSSRNPTHKKLMAVTSAVPLFEAACIMAAGPATSPSNALELTG